MPTSLPLESLDRFISVDWGTTHLRVRLVQTKTGHILNEVRSDEGVSHIASSCSAQERPNRFRMVLEATLKTLSTTAGTSLGPEPVLVSGMASSSIGWQEVPYATLPAPLDGTRLAWTELDSLQTPAGAHRIFLFSGVRTTGEIMRGEETQVLGLAWHQPQLFDRANLMVVLPGTHSKHVQVRDGALQSFCTFMTGELFQVLAEHSVLRHSVGARENAEPEKPHQARFIEGIELGATQPLSAALFQVRTRQVLEGRTRKDARELLSGILIGAELGLLRKADVEAIVLCGVEDLTVRYVSALTALGLGANLRVIDDDVAQGATAFGHAALIRHL